MISTCIILSISRIESDFTSSPKLPFRLRVVGRETRVGEQPRVGSRLSCYVRARLGAQ